MTGLLQEKVAIVTGGARGIGAGIAQRLLAEGAHVVVADVLVPDLQDTSGEFIQCDVTQPDQIVALFDGTVRRYGKLDILVNNAAILGGTGKFLDVKLSDWQRYIDTNLTGAFAVGQAAARAMVSGQVRGRIVNIGSVNSFAAEPGVVPYAASKGGVLLLTKAMAVDLAPYGILVNCIAPGPIKVARNAALFESEPLLSGLMRTVPLGGPGTPDDVAAAVVFLVSDQNQFITGASLLVDGGSTAVLNYE